jgi:hypothetical protein
VTVETFRSLDTGRHGLTRRPLEPPRCLTGFESKAEGRLPRSPRRLGKSLLAHPSCGSSHSGPPRHGWTLSRCRSRRSPEQVFGSVGRLLTVRRTSRLRPHSWALDVSHSSQLRRGMTLHGQTNRALPRQSRWGRRGRNARQCGPGCVVPLIGIHVHSTEGTLCESLTFWHLSRQKR